MSVNIICMDDGQFECLRARVFGIIFVPKSSCEEQKENLKSLISIFFTKITWREKIIDYYVNELWGEVVLQ